MRNLTANANGKGKTVADLENYATDIENNLEVVDKNFIKKMLNVFNCIMNIAKRKEDGIFNVILRWFRLYLKLNIIINPEDKKLIKYYENTVPVIITYIIGCLQYKAKEVPNYHINLLNILEEIMESIQPSVLKQITKFEKGTIGCLWNPIDLAGDFNTQLKTLKILSELLKQFDENRLNEELKCIKWTNLNLFQCKLKTIVQETKLSQYLENCSRDLLNNYNMNLAKNVMVYSFHCKTAILSKVHQFYKPLNIQSFWIDINYCPKTLSFTGRYKIKANSKYENIKVTLKIKKMILNNNMLKIYFDKPGDFSSHSDYLSNIADNIIEFTLTNKETERLIKNDHILVYFNDLRATTSKSCEKNERRGKSTFDLLKNEMAKSLEEITNKKTKTAPNFFKFNTTSTPEENMNISNNISQFCNKSPKTSTNIEKDMNEQPLKRLRKRKKFFQSVIEESCEESQNKKVKRKKSQKPKSRQTRYKQICKVIPTVDLTKIENIDSINETEIQTKKEFRKIDLENNVSKNNSPLINTQVYDAVLKQVAELYDPVEYTYAEPCQSYRNFETHIVPIRKTYNTRNVTKANGRKKKNNLDNESSIEKKRKLANCSSQENKENINPQNSKSIFSPHLFETQYSDEIPSNKLAVTNRKGLSSRVQNTQIDLTLTEIEQLPICCDRNQEKKDDNENISSSGSLDEVRSFNQNLLIDIESIFSPTKTILTNSTKVNTPQTTSYMNLSDSDMDITEVYNCQSVQEQQSKIYENIDMELTEPCCSPKFFPLQQFENEYKNVENCQLDFEASKQNYEVPFDLQQIIKDFDCSSDDESNSNIKILTERFLYDNVDERNYNRDCIIFQNRKDIEEFSSADEESNYSEVAECSEFFNCDKLTNQNFPILQNRSQFANQNLCQNELKITSDENSKIGQNVTSRISTKCQVTPTSIILHRFEVSANKSVILRKTNAMKISRANKCLNNYFSDKNKSGEMYNTVQNQNLYNFKELNCIPFQRKNPICYTKFHANPSVDRLDTPTANNNSKNNISKPLSVPRNENTIKTSSTSRGTNRAGEIDNNKFGSSGHNILYRSESLRNLNSSFTEDLFHIIQDYDANMKLHLDNFVSCTLKNISDKYTNKFLDIAKIILKKFNTNKLELQEMRLNMARLLKEFYCQCDEFINKSNEFDIDREITERIMDIPNFLAKDYEGIIKQSNSEQNGIFKKVWKRYLDQSKI